MVYTGWPALGARIYPVGTPAWKELDRRGTEGVPTLSASAVTP